MADQAWLYTAAAAVGGAIATGAGALFRSSERRADRESTAKDVTIAAYAAELAHERGERAREREEAAASLRALGGKLDAMRAQLERERLQAAGVVGRMRLDSTVDETDFEPDMPTAVRNMADHLAPRKSTPPKGTPTPKVPAPSGRYKGPEK
jgi:hypothetical protein